MSGIDDLVGTGMVGAQASAIKKRTLFIPGGCGHVGATAGFATNFDTGEARCPAAQTAATFILPMTNLRLGDKILSFKIIAQIESGGNTATLDASMRKLTNAAADPADSSLGAITQVSATSDTAVSSSKTLATAEVVATGEMPYILVTVTTAASTDVRLLGAEVLVIEA